MKTFESKDPDALKDYTIDWSRWLQGDTIVSSIWIVPAGITKASATAATSSTVIWLSGGMHAAEFVITNRITTAAGRIEDRSFVVPVRHT